jgi:glycerol-3-phosphate dehydrogenase
MNRSDRIAKLQQETLDVLVIGGGIVGAGIARDAALRGLRIGLVEQADFAAGTSSRSSRLLHGGIRYLAQGRIGLVREASKEKTIIGRIAPHLAQPLPFIFPTWRGTPWSYWKLSVGVRLYDVLCGMKNFGRSSSLNIAAAKKLLPGLTTRNLTGAVRYFDALTNDARLVIDTLRSAERHDAQLLNHVKFLDARSENNGWLCTVRDQLTAHEFSIRAQAVVNAAGPWADKLPHSKTKLRLTKGVHMVIDHQRLPVPEAVVMTQGNRVLFAIPWGERVILGTTDTDYNGDLANPTCDARDIAEVLGVVNTTFPEANIAPSDVISTWSGLRPLVADPNGDPSDISRRHNIDMSNPGWWDVTGGKLTTYRLMAEETVDKIVRHFGFKSRSCSTAELSIQEGNKGLNFSGILPPPISQEVVQEICRTEWPYHLDDVMIRRTSWHYYHRERLAIAENVADWMAGELGWSDADRNSQLERYQLLTC